jgi:hypothetical protein
LASHTLSLSKKKKENRAAFAQLIRLLLTSQEPAVSLVSETLCGGADAPLGPRCGRKIRLWPASPPAPGSALCAGPLAPIEAEMASFSRGRAGFRDDLGHGTNRGLTG